MIRQLFGHITQEQINSIVNIIITQYAEYNRVINSRTFRTLFSDEYAPHNKQFSISWAISSGFPSGQNIVDGMQISCYEYSRKFTRPLLSNSRIKVLILNKTTHFKADYLNDFYELNANNFRNDQLFCYFKFSVEKKVLTSISICLTNASGAVVQEEQLLNKHQIEMRISA